MSHTVVSGPEWLAARRVLLAKEKELTRARDVLSRERRELPWEAVTKTYEFDGPNGKETLADLFAGRSQLVVYHFMFAPEWDEGCPHCSFFADHFNGAIAHLNQRDVTMAVVSRAPFAKLSDYEKRMGWSFKWVSSGEGPFNYDYHVSFTPEEAAGKPCFYNYAMHVDDHSDREGLSVFFKDGGGAVFHTYSTYARGIDLLGTTYNILDMVPKGRDEGDEGPSWVRRHDEY